MTADAEAGARRHLKPFELGFRHTPLRRHLVDAVLEGRKTATSSLRLEYEPHTTDLLPVVGERFLLLDFDDEPVAVVETAELRVVPAAEVDLQFAIDEGEGFETVAQWREAHEHFWTTHHVVEGLTDETLVVCERFRLVHRL